MKSPKWVATTRQLIKSNHGFGWSISGWEKNKKRIEEAKKNNEEKYLTLKYHLT